ncbi:MAG: hypothetical protein AB7F96_07080 [Beijerinckiaceae bacterium]
MAAAGPALAQATDRAKTTARFEKGKANFQQADADRDGRLNYGEFVAFIDLNANQGLGRAASIRQFRAYKRAFEHLDTNRDGTVSPQELTARAQR